jgi:hypothetical protein
MNRDNNQNHFFTPFDKKNHHGKRLRVQSYDNNNDTFSNDVSSQSDSSQDENEPENKKIKTNNYEKNYEKNSFFSHNQSIQHPNGHLYPQILPPTKHHHSTEKNIPIIITQPILPYQLPHQSVRKSTKKPLKIDIKNDNSKSDQNLIKNDPKNDFNNFKTPRPQYRVSARHRSLLSGAAGFSKPKTPTFWSKKSDKNPKNEESDESSENDERNKYHENLLSTFFNGKKLNISSIQNVFQQHDDSSDSYVRPTNKRRLRRRTQTDYGKDENDGYSFSENYFGQGQKNDILSPLNNPFLKTNNTNYLSSPFGTDNIYSLPNSNNGFNKIENKKKQRIDNSNLSSHLDGDDFITMFNLFTKSKSRREQFRFNLALRNELQSCQEKVQNDASDSSTSSQRNTQHRHSLPNASSRFHSSTTPSLGLNFNKSSSYIGLYCPLDSIQSTRRTINPSDIIINNDDSINSPFFYNNIDSITNPIEQILYQNNHNDDDDDDDDSDAFNEMSYFQQQRR